MEDSEENIHVELLGLNGLTVSGDRNSKEINPTSLREVTALNPVGQ